MGLKPQVGTDFTRATGKLRSLSRVTRVGWGLKSVEVHTYPIEPVSRAEPLRNTDLTRTLDQSLPSVLCSPGKCAGLEPPRHAVCRE